MLTFFVSHNSGAFKFRRYLPCYLKRYETRFNGDKKSVCSALLTVGLSGWNFGVCLKPQAIQRDVHLATPLSVFPRLSGSVGQRQP